MPALSEHREDIPELVERILEHKAREANVPMPHLSLGDMARLLAYEWPGNVRQLDHALEHYIAFGKLPEAVLRAPRSRDWRERLDKVLQRHGGNKTAAAGELGISRKTLHEELRRRKAQS